jgi:hypothetical protein
MPGVVWKCVRLIDYKASGHRRSASLRLQCGGHIRREKNQASIQVIARGAVELMVESRANLTNCYQLGTHSSRMGKEQLHVI